MNLITFEVSKELQGKICVGHCTYSPGDHFMLTANQARRWIHDSLVRIGILRIVAETTPRLIRDCVMCGAKGTAEPVVCSECDDAYMMCKGCVDDGRCPSCDGDFKVVIEKEESQIEWDDVPMAEKTTLFERDDEI